ncbi:MAG: hypothetical protein AAGA87_06500 [Pseudomonadota bacterium]
MLVPLIVSSLIETLPVAPRPMTCMFTNIETAEDHVEITLRAQPSLKDVPGLYRVQMHVDGRRLKAAAQPIAATDTEDVIVRANLGKETLYLLGVDSSGLAALNIVWRQVDDSPERRASFKGKCRSHERYIRQWAEN